MVVWAVNSGSPPKNRGRDKPLKSCSSKANINYFQTVHHQSLQVEPENIQKTWHILGKN
jgi:hypothetical protein